MFRWLIWWKGKWRKNSIHIVLNSGPGNTYRQFNVLNTWSIFCEIVFIMFTFYVKYVFLLEDWYINSDSIWIIIDSKSDSNWININSLTRNKKMSKDAQNYKYTRTGLTWYKEMETIHCKLMPWTTGNSYSNHIMGSGWGWI